MGFKIYHKTKMRRGALSTSGKFEQYDRKEYKSESAAKTKIEEYKQKYGKLDKASGTTYEIRKTRAKKRRDPYSFW